MRLQTILNKISILLNGLHGILLRFWFTLFPGIATYQLNHDTREKKIIVTLTSYGRRAEKILQFSIISLLRQSLKPDKIIVWLDNVNWNMDNLPENLKRFTKIGVEFQFCEDLRSFKKLIPALRAYPEDILITVDDDLYYRKTLLQNLYESYQLHPNQIHCAIAHQPVRNEAGNLLPYNSWNKNAVPPVEGEIFPTGGAGCLYPPHSLHPDVTNSELFMKLCPTADDVWFWVMGKMQGTQHHLVQTPYYINLDLVYEYTHKNAALTHENVFRNANDTQIKNAFEHYNLK